MIITLTRSGGFTGIPQKKTIDTKKLPPEKAQEIEELVGKTDLVNSVGRGTMHRAPTKPQPDRFSYTIAIENDSLIRSLPIHEENMSQDMRKLVESLLRI